MRRIVQAAVLTSLSLLLTATPSLAVPIMQIDFGGGASSASIGVGGVATASITASGIPAGSVDPTVGGPGMFGFGFDLTFNDAGASASNLTLGPLWSGTGFDSSVNDPGRAGLTSNRFFLSSGPSGDDILLGTLDLEGLAPGTYDLTLGYFTGAGDNTLFDGTVLDSDPVSFFGTGTLSVPEPGVSSLYLGGFLLLVAARRR